MDQEYSFTLFSKEPISITIDDRNLYVIDNINIHYVTFLSNHSSFPLQVHHEDNSQSIMIESIRQDGKENEQYTILQTGTKSFDIYLHPTGLAPTKKEIIYHHKDQETSFVVTKSEQLECCYYDSGIPCGYAYFDLCSEFNCNRLGRYFYLIGLNTPYTYIIVADTESKRIVFSHTVDEYQFSSESVTLLYHMHDHHRHGKVTKFSPTQKEEYFVYLDKNTENVTEETLVPQAFLECVMCEDYSRSMTYLSSDLKTSKEHLKQFFGTIDKIYYTGKKDNILSYTIQSGKDFHRYEFTMKDKRIHNIM